MNRIAFLGELELRRLTVQQGAGSLAVLSAMTFQRGVHWRGHSLTQLRSTLQMSRSRMITVRIVNPCSHTRGSCLHLFRPFKLRLRRWCGS